MFSNLKLYAIAAALIALLALAAYVNHLQDKAAERDAAVASLALEKAQSKAREAQWVKATQDDEQRRAGLTIALNAVSDKVKELESQVPTKSVKYVPVPGKPEECPQPRLDPQFVSVWNGASDASASPVPDTR